MPDKYLTIDSNGNRKEVAGLVTSAGAGDAGKIPALDAGGKFDASLMPSGFGADANSVTASESIGSTDIVNVWDSTGPKVRKADASGANGSKRAVGFVKAAIANGAAGTVYYEGILTGLTGLTPGTIYFLSGATPGAITATAPTTAGHIVQKVGTAISTTELSFEPEDFVIRA